MNPLEQIEKLAVSLMLITLSIVIILISTGAIAYLAALLFGVVELS